MQRSRLFARGPRTPLALLFLLTLGMAWFGTSDALAKDELTRGLRYPSVSQDGKLVTFAYRGDIWVAETAKKGRITRLTIHEAQDTLPRFSPDGKQIAFSSTRQGGYNIYVVPVTGGVPKRVTHHSGTEILWCWSPDGKKLCFGSDRDPTKRGLDVYEIALDGGTTVRLTDDGNAREAAYSRDGKQIVFVKGSNTIYQDNYEGSGNHDIWTAPVKAAGESVPLSTRVTKTAGNERYPWFSQDGKTIWFIAEHKGVANFYSMPAAGGERTQVTKYTGNDVHRPSPDWKGEGVTFEIHGQVYRADLAKSGAPRTRIDLSVKSDVRHSGVVNHTISSGVQQAHLDRAGNRMACSRTGDIWILSASGGAARRITSGAANDEWPRWSPDGRWIAFQSNRSGNSDIWLMKPDGSGIKQLTKDKQNDFFHNWSPDGSKLVFCSERSGNRDIWTIDVATGETTRLTKHGAGDDDPTFSPDGRLIAFDSAREGNQAIFVMNADGSGVRRVTTGSGFLQVPTFSPDGKFLVYESFNAGSGNSAGLFVIAVGGGSSMRVSRDGSTACWSGRGDYIYFTAGPTDRQEIFRVPAPTSIENREKIPFQGTVEVDTRKELEQLFDEAWTRLRDGFYDAKMHGVDWNAMRKKYRQMAIDSEVKEEFQNVVRQMIAELNASHLGIGGGTRPSNAVRSRGPATGYLGAELAEVPGKGGGRKVLAITKGGPADRAGLRRGDEITQIAGKKLAASTDIDRVLSGTVGKGISLRFRPITDDGLGDERRLQDVKPVPASVLRSMRHSAWLKRNVKIVRTVTKGRIAYIHLDAMNPKNLSRFQRAVGNWIQSKRIKGMVLDVRDNGGGNIHQQLMQILTAKPFARVALRGNRRRVSQPALYWDRPVVVMINQNSFSDAEVFPFIFKALKRGSVVGVPTPGGVIGTNDISLSDGTRFRIPRVGYYGVDGTNLEGLGVKPDFFVEETQEDRRANRDPQLAKAIEIVLAEVKGKAIKPTTPKADKPSTTQQDAAPKPEPKKIDAQQKRTAGRMDPLADATVGEWTRYRVALPGQEESIILKVTITDISDGMVTTENEIEEGPAVQFPLPTEWEDKPLIEALEGMGEVASHQERSAQVKGEDTKVVTATVAYGGGQLVMTFTNKIPGLGLFTVQLGKFTLMEAIEWGAGEPADEEPTATPTKVEPTKAATTPKAPVTAPKAGGTPVANPLFDAKAGEWIRFRNIVQGQETIATLRVVEVTDDEVVLESTVAHGKTIMKGDQIRRPRRKQMNLRGREVKVEKTTLEVNGKTLACLLITRTNRRGTVDRRWISTDVAVTGLVKRERGGKVVSEVLDWGVGEK